MPRALVLLTALFCAGAVSAQGFAGLGTTAEDFAQPQRGTVLEFPRDHGAHPDYRIEWWYLTAVLDGADGQDYGVQWTLFRSALAPASSAGWDDPQFWMGHAGLTTADAHFSAERLGRGGVGQAGVTAEPFAAWIDDWEMRSTAEAKADAFDALSVRARGGDFAFDLQFDAQGPLVLQGDGGYSVKSEDGQASFYYSQPFFTVTGTLDLPSGAVEVTGQGWLDREWSSQIISEVQDGWDWVSLIFDDGSRMMGFQVRDAHDTFTSGTWIDPDGTATPAPHGAVRFEALERATVAGREVPVRWHITWPERDVDIRTTPLNPQSWMDTAIAYWEGPLRFEGSHSGRGYLEMTGY